LVTVNELSNTMDLDSTLIRAEVLFRRFQRFVEAIDKKENFPQPRRQPTETPESNSASAADGSSPAPNTGKALEPAQVTRVITPELRKLLSKEVEILPRKTVAKGGDGFGRV
jgi:TBC1 domain family member 15